MGWGLLINFSHKRPNGSALCRNSIATNALSSFNCNNNNNYNYNYNGISVAVCSAWQAGVSTKGERQLWQPRSGSCSTTHLVADFDANVQLDVDEEADADEADNEDEDADVDMSACEA